MYQLYVQHPVPVGRYIPRAFRWIEMISSLWSSSLATVHSTHYNNPEDKNRQQHRPANLKSRKLSVNFLPTHNFPCLFSRRCEPIIIYFPVDKEALYTAISVCLANVEGKRTLPEGVPVVIENVYDVTQQEYTVYHTVLQNQRLHSSNSLYFDYVL